MHREDIPLRLSTQRLGQFERFCDVSNLDGWQHGHGSRAVLKVVDDPVVVTHYDECSVHRVFLIEEIHTLEGAVRRGGFSLWHGVQVALPTKQALVELGSP